MLSYGVCRKSLCLNLEYPLFIDSDSSDAPNIYGHHMPLFKHPMMIHQPIKIRYDFAGPFDKLLTLKEFVWMLKRKGAALYEKARLRMNLENPDQNLLVRLIIEHLLDKDVEIELGKKSIIYLFTLIKHVFPNERIETYYVPSSKKKPTSGKLYKRFQNRRLELKKHGLIKRRDYDY